MKIFVTVGTTKFNSLIQFIDENFLNTNYNFIMQIADGNYKPKNFDFFEYSDEIEKFYVEHDFVITHAGAGTIFHLLELQKKILIVPNFDRVDVHQLDIAKYMHKNRHALTIFKFEDLFYSLQKISSMQFEIFEKIPFFKAKEIIEFIFHK